LCVNGKHSHGRKGKGLLAHASGMARRDHEYRTSLRSGTVGFDPNGDQGRHQFPQSLCSDVGGRCPALRGDNPARDRTATARLVLLITASVE